MEPLNYHHLHYFWAVAKSGSLAAASTLLQVAQPTISIQLKKLEESLQISLFRKAGRRLELTEIGEMVYRRADEIFALGRDLQAALNSPSTTVTTPFVIGISSEIPASLAYRLLSPAMHLPSTGQTTVLRGEFADLFGELAAQRIQAIITSEAPRNSASAGLHHSLGQAPLALFGIESLMDRYGRNFPQSLEGAPVILPSHRHPWHLLIVEWFTSQRVRLEVIAESIDASLQYELAAAGRGLVVAPELLAATLLKQYGLQKVGPMASAAPELELLAPPLEHAATSAILSAARDWLSNHDG